MKNQKLLTIVLVVLLFLLAFLVLYQKNNSLKEFDSPTISFIYPKGYKEQPKPQPGKNQAKTLAELHTENSESIIVFAKEEAAIKGANLLKVNFLSFLESNAEKKFPIVYKNYQKQKTERIRISGHEATLVSFSYTGRDDETKVYVNLFIFPLTNDAYYLTIQSTDKAKLDTDTKIIQPTIKFKQY